MTEGLFTIPNRQSTVVSRQNPWDFNTDHFPEFSTKREFREWECLANTETCLYSLVEGEIPNLGLSKQNKPNKLFGIVADYDGKRDDAEFKQFMSVALEQSFVPNYVCRSYSGGIHAIYLFEEGIVVPEKTHLNRFLTKVKKELRLNEIGRGWDESAFKNLYDYYSVGSSWKKVHDTPIKLTSIYHWLYESSKTEDYAHGHVAIPMEKIAEEMEKQFPGEITNMQNGSRCRYFWGDNQGTNSSSCIVRPEGMTVFTDRADKNFYTWAEILGNDFVRQFEEDKIGGAIAPYWFDGREYIYAVDDSFKPMSKESLSLSLVCRHGLNGNRPRRGGPSEVNKAIFTIEDQKYVDGVSPFVYIKDRIVDFHGKQYFNTATAKPMEPVQDVVEWGDRFPTIAKWLDLMFGKKQIRYAMAWLSYAYRHALMGDPQKGQAQFLCGPKDCGKTVYNITVLGRLFGGNMKCSDYFMGKTTFNDFLFECGLWTIDDGSPASDKKKLDEYTSMIKEFVANDEFFVSAKFKKGARVFWRGRLSITLNTDAEDIRMLPDLSMSINDKLMVFEVFDHFKPYFTRDFKTDVENELPYFAGWLYNHETPEDLVSVRFGVAPFINETIRMLHRQSGELETFLAIVDWVKTKFSDPDIPGRDGVWEGTAGDIIRLSEGEGARALTRQLNPTSLGIGLNKLYEQGMHGLERLTRGGKTVWKICS